MIPPDDKQENGADSFIDRMRLSHANESAQGEMDLQSVDRESTVVEVALVSVTRVESTADSNKMTVPVPSGQQEPAKCHDRENVSGAEPENASAGVVKIKGRMVERLHLDMARQLLERAERLAGRV